MGEAVDEDRLQQPLEVVERPARHGYAEHTHTHTHKHTHLFQQKKRMSSEVYLKRSRMAQIPASYYLPVRSYECGEKSDQNKISAS